MKEKFAQHKSIIVAGLVLFVLAVLVYWRYSILYPNTDDAYVQANIVNIAPQIPGQVNAISVQNHQSVQKGDLLFTLDPRPFSIALQQAQAQFEITQQQIASDQDAVNSAQAVLAQRMAQYKNALADSTRAIKLAKQGVLSRQAADDAYANIATRLAAVNTAKPNFFTILTLSFSPSPQSPQLL